MVRKVLLLIDFSEEYGRGLLSGIAKYSRLFGPWSFFRLPLVYRSSSDISDLLQWAREWNADGIIAQIDNEQVFRQLKSLDIPIIAQDANERFADIPNISGLYRQTGAIAAGYFLSKGFRNFAFYGFMDKVWSRERGEGFYEELAKKGFSTAVYPQGSEQGAARWWQFRESSLSDWLVSLPKPVAVFCCDDNQGQHVTEACRIAGIPIPEQVSVLGVDNDASVCSLSDPPLSSIALNTDKAGFETARLLDRMMSGKNEKVGDILVEPVAIHNRRSTEFLAVKDKETGKALQFIHRHFREPIQVGDVVRSTALSRRVLENRFRKLLNRSIIDEITALRVEHVAQLLRETELTIAEVADSCGFTDVRNMARYFGRAKGMTPLAYRRRNRG